MAHHGVATEEFFRASLPPQAAEAADDGAQPAHHSAAASLIGLQDVFFDVAGNAAVHLEHAVSICVCVSVRA